jgi:5-methylcytosine-specific restriction protein A
VSIHCRTSIRSLASAVTRNKAGPISAHFEVGEHGLFNAMVVDVGGKNRYSESASLVTPAGPFLFSEQALPCHKPAAMPDVFVEGGELPIDLTRYERSRAARQACIEHWGTCCCVCGFDFEINYGELGIDYIQVHHLVPLAEIGDEYDVDPIKDLRPVCPNCHAMIHRREPPLSIEDLRRIVERERKTPGA